MDNRSSKVMNLGPAIERYVKKGCHLSIGGFTVNRNPMAAVHEIIRRGIKDIHLYVHSNGQGADELVGGGCITKMDVAYGANGRFAPTCVRFKKAVQEGSILIEDYTNFQMILRFLAGAMGIPFLPTRSGLGTDIFNKWGYSPEVREKDPGLPDKKLVDMDNPFGDWTGVSKVILVPAINPDVTVIHVQKADMQGNCLIKGLSFADVEQAKAAKKVIVTCEELVDRQELCINPDLIQIPFLHVSAVVHVPFGAYPTACYGYYDYDPVYLYEYFSQAQDEEKYTRNRRKYIYEPADHQALMEIVGGQRLEMIRAESRTGYARNLKRI